MNSIPLIVAVIVAASLLGCGPNPPTESGDKTAETHSVILRDIDGSILLSDGDIVSYDLEQHVITLKPGVKNRLNPSQSLIGGSPFTVLVDGTPLYSGKFTTSLSSQSIDDVVINLITLEGNENKLQISLGYPVRECYTADRDPRDDPRLVSAFRALRKTADNHAMHRSGGG